MLDKLDAIPDKLLAIVLRQENAAADDCQRYRTSRIIFCNTRNLCGGYCWEYRYCTYCVNKPKWCERWHGCSCHTC